MIFSKSIVRGLCLPTGAIVVCAIKLRKINLGLTKQSLVVFLEINYFLLCTYKPSKLGTIITLAFVKMVNNSNRVKAF